MEREDKLSYKYEMQCLSDLFKERFEIPSFPKVVQKDVPIKLSFSKLPSSFVRLVPQEVSESTMLPKNAPEIAYKALKKLNRKSLKPASTIEVKVKSKKLVK